MSLQMDGDIYRKKCWIRSKTLDSLMAWLGEKRKTEFSWTQANQAMSESRIVEWIQHFLRYLRWKKKTLFCRILLNVKLLSQFCIFPITFLAKVDVQGPLVSVCLQKKDFSSPTASHRAFDLWVSLCQNTTPASSPWLLATPLISDVAAAWRCLRKESGPKGEFLMMVLPVCMSTSISHNNGRTHIS